MKLTKSEFLQGRDCHERVVLKRQGIASKNDDNEMMRELADNGQIIHFLARKLHLGALHGASLSQLLEGAPIRSHEVPLTVTDFEARADMIRVDARSITMTEVKSERYPVDDDDQMIPLFTKHGKVDSRFAELIADITFQALILEEMLVPLAAGRTLPLERRYELMLLHPFKQTPPRLLRQNFEIWKGAVSCIEEPYVGDIVKLFVRVDVTEAVTMMMATIAAERRSMLNKIRQQQPPVLSSKCKSCEFRTIIYGEEPNGFLSCWQEMTFATPHILNVPNIHSVKISGEDAVTVLTQKGKASAADIPEEELRPGYNSIQERTIRAFTTNEEQQEPELVQTLSAARGPHVFIDVEAFNGPLSLWPGGRPYEVAAFQWSCHQLSEQGELTHSEWLHEEDEHPAVSFLTSLYHAVKSAGTIYIWSPYERTAVSQALESVAINQQEIDEEVRQWAQSFTDKTNPNVIDMLEFARKYYVHPNARGSNSIKKVLDAIWIKHYMQFMPTFAQYLEITDGWVASPYQTLPVNYESARLATVRDGTQAMAAYQDMLHGTGKRKSHVRANLRAALLEYCKLDTAAMVIIYEHWMR